jgi:hypothetical protein
MLESLPIKEEPQKVDTCDGPEHPESKLSQNILDELTKNESVTGGIEYNITEE